MRLVALLTVVATACYQPAAQPGAPCAENFDCPSGQECDRAATPPVCVPRGDAGLSGLDAPSCLGDLTCPADVPYCDPSSATCRRCAADTECPDGVCHELAGRCTPDADTLFVSPTGTDLGSMCTRRQPCRTISRAVTFAIGTRRTIRVADGQYTGFDIRTSGGPILVSGEDAAPGGAQITPGNNDAVSLDPGSVAVIEGLSFVDSQSDGIVSRGDLTLYRVAISNSQQAGIDARNGALTISESAISGSRLNGIFANDAKLDLQRSVVVGNTGGGLNLSNCDFTITNTIIGNNGAPTSANGGMISSNNLSAVQVFRFNTVAGNRNAGGSGNNPGVNCNTPLAIESSILASNGTSSQMSANCSASYSLFTGNLPTGAGNLVGAPGFVSASDFHITAGSPARNAADPSAAEARDVDNQGRTDGQPDIGADEVP